MSSPNREAAFAKAREIAALLDAPLVPDCEDNWHLRFQLAPTILLCASEARERGKLLWRARYNGTYSAGEAPEIRHDFSRAAAALAQDIRTRLIPAAREHCRKVAAAHAASIDEKRRVAARQAQLEEVLGPLAPCSRGYSNSDLRCDGFSVPAHHLANDGNYRGIWSAEISVHSFHCLLMIAKLIAEDRRQHAATHREEDSEDSAA